MAKPKKEAVTQQWDRDPATQTYVDPKRISELRRKVTTACLCVRRSGDEGVCWSSFWKEANEYRSSGEAASACGPGSSSFIAFSRAPENEKASSKVFNPFEDEEMTVMTSFGYGACSVEEVAEKKAEYEKRTARRGC